jgi:hypothetical protein
MDSVCSGIRNYAQGNILRTYIFRNYSRVFIHEAPVTAIDKKKKETDRLWRNPQIPLFTPDELPCVPFSPVQEIQKK